MTEIKAILHIENCWCLQNAHNTSTSSLAIEQTRTNNHRF